MISIKFLLPTAMFSIHSPSRACSARLFLLCWRHWVRPLCPLQDGHLSSHQGTNGFPGSCRPRPLSRLRRSPPFYDCVRGRPFCHIYSNRPQTAQAGFHPFRRSALRTRQPLSTLRLLSRENAGLNRLSYYCVVTSQPGARNDYPHDPPPIPGKF